MKQSLKSGSASYCCILFLVIALVELLDTAAGLNVTLTSREERMALGADIDAKLFLRGTRFERVATAADNSSFVVIRMDTLFHSIHLSFPPGTGNGYKPARRRLGLDLAPRQRGKASQFWLGNRRHYVHYRSIISQSPRACKEAARKSS